MRPSSMLLCLAVAAATCADAPQSSGTAALAPPESEALRPVEVTVGSMTFDGLEAGPSAGPLVLLLHGFPQSADAFRHQLSALGDAGYRAVAPNQRGYSPGARPEAVGDYAMRYLVADVVGIADALGADTFHLVGHDWGGAVAWVVATQHAGRVRSLTVLSTPHFQALTATRAAPGSDQAARSSYFTTWAEPGAEVALLADDAAGLRAVYSGLDDELVARYVERLGTPGALRGALSWYGATFGAGAPASAPSAAPPAGSIPKIQVPVTYVWSTEDSAFGRAAAEATADYVAGPYEFIVIEGVGHWVPELAPDESTRAILARVGPADAEPTAGGDSGTP